MVIAKSLKCGQKPCNTARMVVFCPRQRKMDKNIIPIFSRKENVTDGVKYRLEEI